ncbi:FHA domain-containing protein, partial [Streptomyces sp. ME01-24h]|nr:FHA domain-containing protein [Streptomyces sp. ME01-24h]
MSTCPNGHQSATDDWCEVCGIRMSAPPSPSVPTP